MTKKEKIKEVYGAHWELVKKCVDENGWVSPKQSLIPFYEVSELDFEGKKQRLKKLQGIENNNGWIKINDESDLPKENGKYLARRRSGLLITEDFYVNHPLLWLNTYKITHYQPNKEQLQPVY